MKNNKKSFTEQHFENFSRYFVKVEKKEGNRVFCTFFYYFKDIGSHNSNTDITKDNFFHKSHRSPITIVKLTTNNHCADRFEDIYRKDFIFNEQKRPQSNSN